MGAAFPGGAKSPAATDCAEVIFVWGMAKEARLSQDAAAALCGTKAAATSKVTFK
jgi:hypothetical protein